MQRFPLFFRVAEDLYIDGELSFEEGASLTLESDFYHDGALKMGGGSLKVKEDYCAESSVVDVTDGTLVVDGDMDVKSDASLSLKTQESRLHVKGNLNISSTKADGNQMTEGAIEAEGDINCSEYALPEGFTLKGTKLILSGKKQQTLSLRNELSHSSLEEIDATQSAGVYIPGDVLHVKRIKGLDKIINTLLLLSGLSQRLERDEMFRGSLTVNEDFLSLNGHTLQVTGNLTFLDTVFRPDQGTLMVGSSCFLHGSTVLVMIYADDLLQIGKDFRTTSSMNHSSVLRDGRIELSGNFEQSGAPCSFDSTDNFTMAFVGQGLQGSRFSAPEDSQFANTEGEYIEDYTFGEKVYQRMDAIAYGIVEGIGELMESPDEIIAAAAIALGVEVGAMLEIPLLGKVMAAVGVAGVAVMAYQLRNEMEWIDNDLERIQALAKYITKVIILAVVAISGVKAADVIVKQFTYPVMWSKAIDAVHDNRMIRKLNSLEHYLDDIMTELYYSFSTALCSADDIYAKLAAMVDDDALGYLQKEFGTPDINRMKAFRDVADGIQSVKEKTGRKLDLDEVKYIQDSLFAGAPIEKIIQFVVGGRGSRAYSIECRLHLYEGKIGKKRKGVTGGHNLEAFTKTLEDAGFDLDECIVNITPHPSLEGIYEIKYRFPAGNGKEGLIPNQYKKIKDPKTVYDPLIYSDEQIYEWGKEAMDNGKIIDRAIYGRASNGLGFMGYIDEKKQEITNFFPVFD